MAAGAVHLLGGAGLLGLVAQRHAAALHLSALLGRLPQALLRLSRLSCSKQYSNVMLLGSGCDAAQRVAEGTKRDMHFAFLSLAPECGSLQGEKDGTLQYSVDWGHKFNEYLLRG